MIKNPKVIVISYLHDLLMLAKKATVGILFTIFSLGAEYRIRIYRELEFDHISDAFCEKRIENFVPGNGYLLIAPPGSGKNYLMKTKLVKEALRRGERILYVCSRTALANQVKLQLDARFKEGIKEIYTSRGLRTVHSVGNVDVYLAQELHFNSANRLELSAKPYAYRFVILDEVHQYVTDASFNPHTREVFDFLTESFPYATRIYMSATADYVQDVIVKKESEIRTIWSYHPEIRPGCSANTYALFGPDYINCNLAGDEFTVFQFKKEYSYIRPIFFKEKKQIEDSLLNFKMQGKTLIFTESKSYGTFLKDSLGDRSMYIDADNKNTSEAAAFSNLVKNNKFDTQYLIVTSFLDVGVDLIDFTLCNIVIFSPYAHEIIQMLGRKRAHTGETINLYLRIRSTTDIGKLIRQLTHDKNSMIQDRAFFQSRANYDIDDIPDHFWLKRENQKTSLVFNDFAIVNVEKRICELQAYLNKTDNPEEYYRLYANHIMHLLPGCQEADWMSDEISTPDEFIERLTPFVGHPLEYDVAKEFCNIVLNNYGIDLKSNQKNSINTKTVNNALSEHGISLALSCIKGQKQTWEVKS